MWDKLNNWVIRWAKSNVPWTNVYGVARSIMALSTALTLALNDAHLLFKPAVGTPNYPKCDGNFSIFCIVPNDYVYLNVIRWLCVILLLIVVSGWRPRITGIIHWWITYSFQVSALTLDGGDQAAAVFTLLLIPITLTDPRKWHWQSLNIQSVNSKGNKNVYFRIIALVTLSVIRFQVAIIYFHSAVAKLKDVEWVDGTAVWYFVQLPMLGFPPLLMEIFKPILTSPLIVLPTWGTLVIQFLLFAFLLAPKKYWKYMLPIAIFMHEIFAVMLGLISFSTVMLAVLILYLRPIEDEFNIAKIKNIYPLSRTSKRFIQKKIS